MRERVERIAAVDVELEALTRVGVENGDRDSVCRPAPVKADLDPVADPVGERLGAR